MIKAQSTSHKLNVSVTGLATLGPMSGQQRDWLLLQHVDFEVPGLLAPAFARCGVRLQPVRLYAGDPVPNAGELSRSGGVVSMGGPMNAFEDDRYPFLADERELLAAAAHADLPVLGVCLGAQLLAAALGAAVTPMGESEIGVGDVWYTDAGLAEPAFSGADSPLPVVHWHGDAFDIPEGGQLLASTDHCAQQAFRWGTRAFGLQFHVEMTSRELRSAGANLPPELANHEQLLPAGAGSRQRFLDQLVAVLAS